MEQNTELSLVRQVWALYCDCGNRFFRQYVELDRQKKEIPAPSAPKNHVAPLIIGFILTVFCSMESWNFFWNRTFAAAAIFLALALGGLGLVILGFTRKQRRAIRIWAQKDAKGEAEKALSLEQCRVLEEADRFLAESGLFERYPQEYFYEGALRYAMDALGNGRTATVREALEQFEQADPQTAARAREGLRRYQGRKASPALLVSAVMTGLQNIQVL